MSRLILTEFHDTTGRLRLQIVDESDWPNDVELNIIGPNGGFAGRVILPKLTAAKLGEALTSLYGPPRRPLADHPPGDAREFPVGVATFKERGI